LLFLRYVKWIGIWYFVTIAVVYFVRVFSVFRSGYGVLKSLGWIFFFPELRKFFISFVLDFSLGWLSAVILAYLFIYWLFENVSELEDIERRIEAVKRELNALRYKRDNVLGEIRMLEEKKGLLKQDIDYLEYDKTLLTDELDELKEEIGRLSFKVREALRKGYEEGREKGYRAVINELRSLRIQKSIILDVFDRNKELKSLFKKLTGKTIRQYLEFEKRKRLKGGAGN